MNEQEWIKQSEDEREGVTEYVDLVLWRGSDATGLSRYFNLNSRLYSSRFTKLSW